jgi:hypothetical protein
MEIRSTGLGLGFAMLNGLHTWLSLTYIMLITA